MKFDVFVSFRGTDTGRSFVSHLFHSLLKKQFRTFKHEGDLLVLGNQPAFPQVLQAIEESKIAVVVISVNYTSSVSCLDELVKIIECKEKQSLVVVPIFYGVDPSYFESQAEKLADEMGKHGERDNLEKDKSRDKLEDARRWKNALIELTRTFKDYASRVEEDSAMIDKVMDYIAPHLSETTSPVRTPRTGLAKVLENVRDVLRTITKMDDEDEPIESVKLKSNPESSGENYVTDDESIQSVKPKLWLENSMHVEKNATENKWSRLVPSSDFNSLVGMDRQMKAVATLLKLDSKDGILEIGIWGEVGVGKTTLSRYFYGQISPKFQEHYYHNFLNDTTKSSLSRSPTCLLEEITKDIITPISSNLLTSYCDVVKAKLGHRKVLLIIDGVDQMGQLKNIRKIARLFGPGSRLILVTQDKTLLQQCEVTRLYEVESLKYDEALQLFSQFAFKQGYILKGFDQLCVRAVYMAGRLPLALRVLGSLLCGKNIKEWEFELLRLEASQANCTAVVSSYIRSDFYQRRPTKLNQYIVGEDDERDAFPSYCFA